MIVTRLVLVSLFCLLPCAGLAASAVLHGRVVGITDGDTLTLLVQTPRTKSACTASTAPSASRRTARRPGKPCPTWYFRKT
jgi:hypothetical protein